MDIRDFMDFIDELSADVSEPREEVCTDSVNLSGQDSIEGNGEMHHVEMHEAEDDTSDAGSIADVIRELCVNGSDEDKERMKELIGSFIAEVKALKSAEQDSDDFM